MPQNKKSSDLKLLIFCLWCISLGGLFLHLKIHPPSEDHYGYFPFVFGIMNLVMIPILLNSKKYVIFGYLINGFGIVLGTITMMHLSITGFESSLNFSQIILKSTLADILLLLPKLFLGQMILSFYYPAGTGRMFTKYWWIRHFVYFTLIYFAGTIIRS